MTRQNGAVTAPLALGDERGFLPREGPLPAFRTDRHGSAVASYLERLDELGAGLPDLLEVGDLRSAVRDLETPPVGLFDELSGREVVRVCLLSGFFASGYVNRIGSDPVDRLPAGAAVPLYRSSGLLGRKPILSYDVLCLHNWRRRDPDGGFAVENLDTIQQFRTLDDERWFVVIHVAIEMAAAPGLAACRRAQDAIRADDSGGLRAELETVADSLEEQTEIMRRMTEGNEPEVFATEFRPYYDGFDEVIYEGVDAFDGNPRTYRGGSGAQSCVLPSIDAALGVEHEATELIDKLGDMRSYMPETHRAAIRRFDERPDVRPYVAERDDEALTAAFNRCVVGLGSFREVHLKQVVQYIRQVTGETTGTGGTDYMPFLGKMREETEAQKL
jgi:indoleamine 2,3-dioxygenase